MNVAWTIVLATGWWTCHISQVTVVGIHLTGINIGCVCYAFYVPIHCVPPQLVVFQNEFALPISVKGQSDIFFGLYVPMTANSTYPSSKVNPTQSSWLLHLEVHCASDKLPLISTVRAQLGGFLSVTFTKPLLGTGSSFTCMK